MLDNGNQLKRKNKAAHPLCKLIPILCEKFDLKSSLDNWRRNTYNRLRYKNRETNEISLHRSGLRRNHDLPGTTFFEAFIYRNLRTLIIISKKQ